MYRIVYCRFKCQTEVAFINGVIDDEIFCLAMFLLFDVPLFKGEISDKRCDCGVDNRHNRCGDNFCRREFICARCDARLLHWQEYRPIEVVAVGIVDAQYRRDDADDYIEKQI